MPLISQALTTMATVRLNLSLYTLTNVTSIETLTADTAAITYTFSNSYLAPNYFGTFREDMSAITTSGITMEFDYTNGTVTFSAARTGSITTDSYSYYAWDYSNDLKIERYINSISQGVSKYCNRNFIKDTYTEYQRGSGRQRLLCNQYPINYITSVTVDDSTASLTAGTDYITSNASYLASGIIFKEDGWTWSGYELGLVGELTAPLDNTKIIYSAGYTLSPESSRTLPYDLENAVIDMITVLYQQQDNQSNGLKSLKQGELTYTWKDTDLIQQYSSTLNSYKKISV